MRNRKWVLEQSSGVGKYVQHTYVTIYLLVLSTLISLCLLCGAQCVSVSAASLPFSTLLFPVPEASSLPSKSPFSS